MRHFATVPLLVLAAFLAISASASASADVRQPLEDAVAYEAELTAAASGRTVTGTEKIVVRNAGQASLRTVWLRLWGNAPKGCSPLAVDVQVTGGGKPKRLIRDCTALEVTLDAPLAPKRSTTLTLDLRITAPSIRDRFGTTEGLTLFGNALPIVAQRDRDGWRLPPGSPFGESFVSTWAQFSLSLTHPSALQVAAAGTTTTVPIDAATSLTTSTVEARDTFWAIGRMAVTDVRTARGTLIRVWSPPDAGGDRSDAARDSAPALEALERQLPQYPYDELDVVVARIDAGGGMEYPTAIITDGSTEVTRHEIAHQWFYALIGNDQYREPWIDEGFTSFLEYGWSGASLAPPLCYPAARLSVPAPQRFVTQTMRYWNKHPGRYWFVYQNPVCALRAQQRLLGGDRFRRVVRSLVTEHERGVLTGDQVRRAFRAAGGRAADELWRTWGMAPPA